MQIILTIIAALLPQTALPVRHADSVELNHVVRVDCNGDFEKRLDQLVFWGRYPGESMTFVRGWTFVADTAELVIDAKAGLVILNGEVFKSTVQTESWTTFDVEVDNRCYLPDCERIPAQ